MRTNEIATASDCSRATVYRYFENRDAPTPPMYTARPAGYSGRSTGRSEERLVEGILASLHRVRESRALSSWFDVIKARAGAYLASLGVDDVERRALAGARHGPAVGLPWRDEAEGRAMLHDFVLPPVIPTAQRTRSN